mmetsp:Transcript_34102/g.88158  ORF Transcript_34102/g.88158 Transcript_34102/m.88158 type:complete len:437 (-) Transcript_34102:64-1374(-)
MAHPRAAPMQKKNLPPQQQRESRQAPFGHVVAVRWTSAGAERDIMCSSLALLLVQLQQCLHVALAAHDDGAAVVDVLGHDVLDAADLAQEHASGGHASCLLSDHSHGEALVQHAKLALCVFLVRRVNEDATVQQGAVHIGDHGADIAGGVPGVLEVLYALEDRSVPLQRVSLVARVDFLAALGVHLHIRDEQELAERGVAREALHAVAEGDDELSGGAIYAVASDNDISPRPQNVRLGAGLVVGRLAPVHGEDRADTDVAVDVRGAVQGIEGHAEGPALGSVLDDDSLLLLLAHEEAADARAREALDPDVVGDDVQLLNVVAGGVGGAGEAIEPCRTRLLDRVAHNLASVLDGVHQHGELLVTLGGLDDVLCHRLCIDAVLEVRVELIRVFLGPGLKLGNPLLQLLHLRARLRARLDYHRLCLHSRDATVLPLATR